MCLMGFFYIYDLTNLDRLKGTYLSSMTEVMSGLVHWRERGSRKDERIAADRSVKWFWGVKRGGRGEENTNKAWTGIC